MIYIIVIIICSLGIKESYEMERNIKEIRKVISGAKITAQVKAVDETFISLQAGNVYFYLMVPPRIAHRTILLNKGSSYDFFIANASEENYDLSYWEPIC